MVHLLWMMLLLQMMKMSLCLPLLILLMPLTVSRLLHLIMILLIIVSLLKPTLLPVWMAHRSWHHLLLVVPQLLPRPQLLFVGAYIYPPSLLTPVLRYFFYL